MSAAPDPALLEEAAGWLVRFQSETLSPSDLAAFERWRGRSAAHAAAWRRVEAMLRGFGQVPPALGARALRQLERPARRQVVRAVAGLLVAGPAAWLAWRELPWREWRADVRTAIGEQRQVLLADGTRLWLNTATAVDILYSARQRLVWLRAGEILLATGTDPEPQARPFLVRTAFGTVRALGTRFMVRDAGRAIQVAVFEDAVEILTSADARRRLHAGQQARFNADGIDPGQAADAALVSWEHGMLAARDWRLADLLAELARYRRGFLRCDPEVAGLRVSGAFPLADTDASLRLLEKTLPVRIQRVTPYWVTVVARQPGSETAVTN
ncbi:MAG: FecR domain-containing protein [Achromobacter sp.]|uniref:FecR domain-containing protein n=1 Tax=Achromobacter sp. TaxID=134375 RepID=UPI003D03E804